MKMFIVGLLLKPYFLTLSNLKSFKSSKTYYRSKDARSSIFIEPKRYLLVFGK